MKKKESAKFQLKNFEFLEVALRKKIDNQEDNKLIHTVIGMGYVLKKA